MLVWPSVKLIAMRYRLLRCLLIFREKAFTLKLHLYKDDNLLSRASLVGVATNPGLMPYREQVYIQVKC